jgi:hypothetical protein
MTRASYTTRSALRTIVLRGGVPDIGQIDGAVARDLDRLVHQGVLVKYRGYWDTLSPDFGLGPLKTIWAPAVAA